MANGFGVREIGRQGRVVRACSIPPPPYKPGGCTVDWSTIAAVNADMTLTDDIVVKTSDKYARYGTIFALIGANATYSVAVTATGGHYNVKVSVDGGAVQTTANIAFDASAATIQAAVAALSNVGVGNVTVTGTGPYIYTFVGALSQHLVTLTIDNTGATGGTATPTQTATGSLSPGFYGPYNSTATDGRQTLVRGACFILDETIVESGFKSKYGAPGGFFDGAGADVFLARVLNNGTDLTTNPTKSQMETAFPGIRWTAN